ncbi:MAG: thiamine-phosphate kinase [Campylobacteraceae bacterium]|nr:thiamine-phosphate kinase [Campylobacteraceae bacterium]
MDKESFIISRFQNNFIGDDAAVIGKWVYSKDLFFEDVHFKRDWFNPYQIARKAMLVNISDAIAMNAKPKYALLGIGIPKNFDLKKIAQLSKGFIETARKYNIKIIGGDTISNEKISISITIIAKKRKHTLYRYGLKEGDILAYTGILGESRHELETLLKGGKIASDTRFAKPILRVDFVKLAAKYLRCGLDISDGLSKDLSRLCILNNLGAEFDKKIDKNTLCSGEEYEMLIAFAPENTDKVLRAAKKTKTPLTIFAKACKGEYLSECKEHHFEGQEFE